MGGKSPATSFVSACVLVFVNLLCMAAAALVFAAGAWMVSSPHTMSAILKRLDYDALTLVVRREALSPQLGGALMLISGIALLVAFLGCCGALARSHFMLLMYSLLMMLLLLLECALFYYIGSQLVERWGGGGGGGETEEGGVWGAAAHALRLGFRCCGRYNYTDLVGAGQQLPWSCCGAAENCTVDRVYTTGCSEAIWSWLSRNQTMVYTTLAAVHVILVSCALVRRANIAPSLSHRP